jgi:hypothetical protein
MPIPRATDGPPGAGALCLNGPFDSLEDFALTSASIWNPISRNATWLRETERVAQERVVSHWDARQGQMSAMDGKVVIDPRFNLRYCGGDALQSAKSPWCTMSRSTGLDSHL